MRKHIPLNCTCSGSSGIHVHGASLKCIETWAWHTSSAMWIKACVKAFMNLARCHVFKLIPCIHQKLRPVKSVKCECHFNNSKRVYWSMKISNMHPSSLVVLISC